jgi:hypothetical protein
MRVKKYLATHILTVDTTHKHVNSWMVDPILLYQRNTVKRHRLPGPGRIIIVIIIIIMISII